MNRRRMLNRIHVTMARHAREATARETPVDVPISRLSIPDLDRIGPKLVTTLPVQRAICIYCTGDPATDAHFPYCSSQCAINAEHS